MWRKYRKAWMAVIPGVIATAVVTATNQDPSDIPEITAAVGTVITTLLVYFARNDPQDS